jgi:hypothetical protein
MGSTLMGSTGSQNLLTPEQSGYLSQAGQGFGQFAQGMSPQDMQSAFQQSVVDPSMQTFNQQVIPGIQQRFVDAGAGSSSALNQALGGAAENLTTSLQSQYLPFLQGQQQNQLSGLGGLQGLAGMRTFQPYQQEGILGDILSMFGEIAKGAAMAASSREVKENIKKYEGGLSTIKDMEVKKFDYKPEFGGTKGTIGLIAEEVPEEFQGEINGVKAVNLYSLIGLLINSMKELTTKVELLEAK